MFSPAYASVINSDRDHYNALQLAEIMGVRPQVERLIALESRDITDAAERQAAVALRAYVLRKIQLAFLQARLACNGAERELAYTYALMQKQQRRQDSVNEYLNLINFARLSTFYTMEPYARIHHQFKKSAFYTTVSGPIGLFIPIVGIYYNKFARIKGCEAPKNLAHLIGGGPVDARGLPETIGKFMDSKAQGSSQTRRQEMYAEWKQRVGADINNPKTLGDLTDGKGKSIGALNRRIVLLWSLHTHLEEFDDSLFSLMNLVRLNPPGFQSAEGMKALGFSNGAIEAARLLKIQPVVEELTQLNRRGDSSLRKLELQTQFLERVLAGLMEMKLATNKIDAELNYAYDVVLANLLMRRGKSLQMNYNANFIQSGTFGSIAGLLYYKQSPKPGNLMFVISDGIGTALSVLALWQMRGGKRKVDTPPNSLADFFVLREPGADSFCPLVWDFLNSPAPDSKDGKSRRQHLLEVWEREKVATVNLENKANQEKVAAIHKSKQDTIAVVRSRINLLGSLKARLESFDGELYDLVTQTDPQTTAYVNRGNEELCASLSKAGKGAACLLGIEPEVENLLNAKGTNASSSQDNLPAKLSVTAKVLTAGLDVRKTMDSLDKQICMEQQTMDRLVRQRDLVVNLTNNANFFQLGILGMIVDGPLGLSKLPVDTNMSNNLNIVSGFMTGGLAALAFMERPGGFSPGRTQPNMLGACFGLNVPSECKFSPLITRFMDAVAPLSVDGLTRRQELIEYWKKNKLLDINVRHPAVQQRVSAVGPGHHFWSENIKLLRNRITMLYDLRATFDMMGYGLADMLQAVD